MSVKTTRKEKIVIENASLVDGVHDNILPKRNIFIKAGVIKEISTDKIKDVSDAETINAEGRFVIPGLSDMHVHCYPACFPLFLYKGVTCVRDMANESKWILAARKEFDEGKILGPRVFALGELIDGRESFWKGYPNYIPARTEEEAVKIVDDLADKGVDAIKLYFQLSPNVFKACINEAHKRSLPVTAHVGGLLTVTEAIKAGVNSIEHASTLLPDLMAKDEFQKIVSESETDKVFLPSFIGWSRIDVESPKAKKLAQFLAESRVYLVPTLVVFEKIVRGNVPSETTGDPNLKYVPETVKQVWDKLNYSKNWEKNDYEQAALGFDNLKRFVKLLFEDRVNLGVGTDVMNPWVIPGFSIIREMELLVECGIPPVKVIQLATNASARFLKRTDLGTIEKGKKAGIAILSANPLEKISNCREVDHIIRENASLDKTDIEKQLGPR